MLRSIYSLITVAHVKHGKCAIEKRNNTIRYGEMASHPIRQRKKRNNVESPPSSRSSSTCATNKHTHTIIIIIIINRYKRERDNIYQMDVIHPLSSDTREESGLGFRLRLESNGSRERLAGRRRPMASGQRGGVGASEEAVR